MNAQTAKLTWIVTHLCPHLDEYLATFLVKMFGMTYYNISPDFQYGYISTTGVTDLEEQHPQALFLGVGGGKRDDHGKKKKFSCCQLVAQELGLMDYQHLYLAKILEAVSHWDKHRLDKRGRLITLPSTINQMHRYGYHPTGVMDWVEMALHGLIASEKQLLDMITFEVSLTHPVGSLREKEITSRFMYMDRKWYYLTLDAIAETLGSQQEYWMTYSERARSLQDIAFKKAEQFAVHHLFPDSSRFGDVKILAVYDDGKYQDCILEFASASTRKGINAHLVLIRDSEGRTLIRANPIFKGSMKEFVEILRDAEARKAGLIIPKEIRGQEGSLEGFPEWYVHEFSAPEIPFSAIYNGTTTRPDAIRSQLTMEEIYDLLIGWLEGRMTVAVLDQFNEAHCAVA